MVVCTRCNQMIDEKRDLNIIEWNNREYHEKCFTCFNCQISLKNKITYSNETNNEFFCSKCIKKTENECFRCKKKIRSNTQYTEFNGEFYHKSCFTCSSCKKSIITKKFYPNNTNLLCEMCYEMTLDKCESCKKIINKGHIIIFQDKTYHDTCMKCAKCKGNIGGKICFRKTQDNSFICRLCDDKMNNKD